MSENFSEVFWRVHKEQLQNYVYNLRHIWTRLTTSEALYAFSQNMILRGSIEI
jgi:hypothetical protein